MILLLDMGNTRIKWGLLSEGRFQSGGAARRSDDSFAVMCAALQSKQIIPARVMAANVAGANDRARLCQHVKASWGCEVEWVVTQAAAFGVINGYDQPQQLGVDRWLALIAVRNITQAATCVIDCGTAVTTDVLNSDGEHLGGMIVPGRALMQATLINNTEGLNEVGEWKNEGEPLFLARNTTDGIMGGAYYALTALIERMALDAQRLIGGDVKLIVSGGDGAVLSQHLQVPHQSEPDLVLKGLAMVAGEALK